MKHGLTILTIIIGIGPWASAQECGTTISESDLLVLKELKRQMELNIGLFERDLGDGLIPVKYHIIATDDSLMGMDTTDLYAEMDIVQSRFAPIGMEFYQCGAINYIYDSDFVDFEKNVSETICDQWDEPDVLNIWFADNVYNSRRISTD